MFKKSILLCFMLMLIAGCKTIPDPEPDHPDGNGTIQTDNGEEKNPVVDQQTYDTVLAEVKATVSNLNTIIKTKDYSRWVSALTEGYFRKLDDSEFLTAYSQKQAEKGYKLTLNSAKDYFEIVFVPSRLDLTADEIFFLRKDVVKVFMVEKKQKTVIYVLKKIGKDWKIEDPQAYN